MKKIFGKQLLLVVLFAFTTILGFSQDKFGGLTLYSVRSEMGTNPEETLQAVADAGYKFIEAASYEDGEFYNMTPEDFKKHVNALGMIPLSTHQSSATLDNNKRNLCPGFIDKTLTSGQNTPVVAVIEYNGILRLPAFLQLF